MMTDTKKRATAADIAAAVGVSKSTVSLAFSAPERVSEVKRKQIIDAARQAGYRPNHTAQSLKTGRNNLLGLILTDLTNPHGGAILDHVQRTASEKGYLVISASAAKSSDRDIEFVEGFERIQIRGTLLMASGSGDSYVKELTEHRMEFVTYGHRVDGLSCDHVGLDNQLAMRMLTQHLVELGHRKIGHVSGPQDMWTGRERLAGVRKAMSAAGLQLDDRYLAPGNFSEDLSYDSALKLLTLEDRPTALIAANNVTAIGVMRAARDLQLRCPEDVSIVTVDEIPWGELMQPRLTCAAQPIGKIAERATLCLIDRIGGDGDRPAAKTEEFAPILKVGTSTARLN